METYLEAFIEGAVIFILFSAFVRVFNYRKGTRKENVDIFRIRENPTIEVALLIEKYKELYDEGAISETEFLRKKRELLGQSESRKDGNDV